MTLILLRRALMRGITIGWRVGRKVCLQAEDNFFRTAVLLNSCLKESERIEL